jgi:hypothetical protein
VQPDRFGRDRCRGGQQQIDQPGPGDADGATDPDRWGALPSASREVAAHLAVGQRPADPQHLACLLDREHQPRSPHDAPSPSVVHAADIVDKTSPTAVNRSRGTRRH